MSISIQHIVLHQLVKKDNDVYQTALRQTLLANTPTVDNMMAEVLRVFNNKNKTYGLFLENSDFQRELHHYLQHNNDFLSFSQCSLEQVAKIAVDYPFIDSSIVLFCHYEFLAKQYLLIALFSSRESTLVNEQLEVSATHYLNIDQADMIATIDITEWQTNPKSVRYLGCLKGRIGRRVTEFFMAYFGAQEGLKTKEENKNLLKAVDEYCDDSGLDPQEKNQCRQHVYSYCQEQLQAGEEISLPVLSDELSAEKDKTFGSFLSEQGYQIAPQFPVDKSVIRRLAKCSGSGAGVAVSFDISLLGDRVIWDSINDTLTIKGLPASLRQQLLQNLAEA